jgi:hypothetical protein
MSKFSLFLTLFLLCAGCGSMNVNDDLFNKEPIWNTSLLTTRPSGPRLSDSTPPATVDRSDAPGLYYLLKQVSGGTDPDLSDNHQHTVPQFGALTIGDDENPLPQDLAKSKVTKAIVISLKDAYLGKPIDDTSLDAGDFKNFANISLREGMSVTQMLSNTGPAQLRIAQFESTGAVTFEAIFTSYFVAYYQGKFVDRYGGTLSKPTLGMTIGDDTITGAFTVLLNAMFDYATMGSVWKDPITFTWTSGKPAQFQTANNQMPTLVAVIESTNNITDPNAQPPTVPGTLESLAPDGKTGMTAQKQRIIAFASGLDSDISGALADLITRTFGGIHIGVVVLGGKFSIGDNDTLSKIVQTAADIFVQRATEAPLATYLYNLGTPREGEKSLVPLDTTPTAPLELLLKNGFPPKRQS